MSDDIQQLQKIVEGAILAAGEPLTLQRITALFDENDAPTPEMVLQAVDGVRASCEGRGFYLAEVASGYRFQVREDLASWVNRLWEEKPQKYSRAMLETLALIAYRQPITRGDIEEVRGVAVSSHIIKTLVEREWVKAVGHRDVPGRPALYATTRQFLDYFGLKSLEELPTLGELRDIDSLNASLEFDSLPPEVQDAIANGKEGSDADKALADDGDSAEQAVSVSADDVTNESQDGESTVDAFAVDQVDPDDDIQAGEQTSIISEETGEESSQTKEPVNQDDKDPIHD